MTNTEIKKIACDVATVCDPPTDLLNEHAAQGQPEGLGRAWSTRFFL